MAGYYRKRGDGSYELDYRRNRKTIQAKSDREAERALAAFIVDADKGKFRKPLKITLKQFIEDRWFRDHVDANLAPGTAHIYKIYVNKRIIPALGHKKLDQIKPGSNLPAPARRRHLSKVPQVGSRRSHRPYSSISNSTP